MTQPIPDELRSIDADAHFRTIPMVVPARYGPTSIFARNLEPQIAAMHREIEESRLMLRALKAPNPDTRGHLAMKLQKLTNEFRDYIDELYEDDTKERQA